MLVFLDELRVPGSAAKVMEYAREFGHEVHSIQVRSRWDREAFVALRKLLDRIRPRLVHAHDVKASLYLMKAGRLRGFGPFEPAMVSTHHGAAARKGLIRLYEEIYVRWALPCFDAVFVVCSADRASLERRGVAREKIHLHLNGVDRLLVTPGDERARIRREIRARWRDAHPEIPDPDETLFLGVVARLSSEKRHDRMIRALAEAKLRYPDRRVALLCFGGGALEAELRRLAQAAGVASDVYWMGYSRTIPQEMAGLDLLLCLSDGEGIPVNLLEAGWSATPVLSTAVGGIPDLIDSSAVGYLVAREDTDEFIGGRIAGILADPKRRSEVGAAYQRHVISRFSERAWLDRLRMTYAALESKAPHSVLP